MRTSLILTSAAAAALLWVSPASAASPEARPASALSPETSCENIKLRAAGAYAQCLAHAAKAANASELDLAEAAIGRCDAEFDRAFERAEAGGACRTAGGPATLRGPIRGQLEKTLAAAKAGPGCPSTPAFDEDTSTYTCTLTSSSAVDLAAIVTQIADSDVTDDTVVWIEAWGGDGGAGNTSNGGPGGTGGYAQITTTVKHLREFHGTSEIYYYLGVKGGGPVANSGGDGGTGTIVTVNDLTREGATFGNTVILAGGAGGGGAGRGKAVCNTTLEVLGAAGGGGGEAISTLATAAFGTGAKGGARRNSNYSGSGGGGRIEGPGGAVNGKGTPSVGDDGIAAIGGRGGNHKDPNVGFFNQSGVKITLSGGKGGEPGHDAGGGGGGGGYGGGGGGAQGIGDTNCVAGGGGGGGSLARASSESCARSRPASNPNGSEGAVQVVFDAGSCS